VACEAYSHTITCRPGWICTHYETVARTLGPLLDRGDSARVRCFQNLATVLATIGRVDEAERIRRDVFDELRETRSPGDHERISACESGSTVRSTVTASWAPTRSSSGDGGLNGGGAPGQSGSCYTRCTSRSCWRSGPWTQLAKAPDHALRAAPTLT
jgi:hypothetical protein